MLCAAVASLAAFGVQSPASASCGTNVGTCDDGAYCNVNVGHCAAGGGCNVNLGYCADGGFCTVNLGACGNIGIFGPGCGISTTTDPTGDDGVVTSELWGGPLLVQDRRGLPLSGTLHCYLQFGNGTPTGTGPGVSGHGTGVVTAGPGQVSYAAGQTVFLCSSFTDDGDGLTYYYDGVTGGYSTTAAGCSPGVSSSTTPEDDPTFELVDAALCPVLLTADRDLGTPLAATWGGCEPYAPII
jgi:hypothetical protein